MLQLKNKKLHRRSCKPPLRPSTAKQIINLTVTNGVLSAGGQVEGALPRPIGTLVLVAQLEAKGWM